MKSQNLTDKKMEGPGIHRIAADWHSVEDIVNTFSIDSTPSFDIHISRRDGRGFVVQLQLPENAPDRSTRSDALGVLTEPTKNDASENEIKKPIHIPAGLYDLYW